jgi:hypothetical protein
MGVRNIFLIIDPNIFSEDDVRKIIREEGWGHSFLFPTMSERSDNNSQLKMADEVWCFGEVSSQRDYKIAVELSCDLWQMA